MSGAASARFVPVTVYDACVLYPAPLRDFLMRLGDLGIEVSLLDEVVADLASFLLPHARRAADRASGEPPTRRRS